MRLVHLCYLFTLYSCYIHYCCAIVVYTVCAKILKNDCCMLQSKTCHTKKIRGSTTSVSISVMCATSGCEATPRGAVDGDESATMQSCTVLDNFYVDKPTWMVDLGYKATVSGVKIVTWQGKDQGIPLAMFYLYFVKC